MVCWWGCEGECDGSGEGVGVGAAEVLRGWVVAWAGGEGGLVVL